MSITTGEALALGKAALAGSSDSSDFDAEVLLCRSLDTTRASLIAWPERELSPAQHEQYVEWLEQRKQGTPIAYLLGEREFWSLDLNVTPDVLIPRPDTELLVELALELGAQLTDDAQSDEQPLKVADLGTGSGAIALALCHEKPHWDITATDLSPQALDVARQNADALEMPDVKFHQGRWCEALPQRDYHLIISNPPYIRADDPHLQQGDLRFEPPQALASGDNGLDDLKTIIHCSREHLRPGGWLLLEHGYDQHQDVQTLLSDAGYENIATQHDLAGIPRVTLGQFNAPTQADIDEDSDAVPFAHPQLDDVQVRILGCLMEKSLSDPDRYPLTLSALQQACNQKTARRPITAYNREEIEAGLKGLMEQELIRISTDERQRPHYRHRMEQVADYNKAQISLLNILMLHGPHTPSELLQRAEHLFTFSSAQHVEKILNSLANHCETPCVLRLERSAGAQENPWMHTFGAAESLPRAQPDLVDETPQPSEDEKAYLRELEQRVSELEEIVAELSGEQPASK